MTVQLFFYLDVPVWWIGSTLVSSLIGQGDFQLRSDWSKQTDPVKRKLASVCAKKKTEILLKCILFF